MFFVVVVVRFSFFFLVTLILRSQLPWEQNVWWQTDHPPVKPSEMQTEGQLIMTSQMIRTINAVRTTLRYKLLELKFVA